MNITLNRAPLRYVIGDRLGQPRVRCALLRVDRADFSSDRIRLSVNRTGSQAQEVEL